MGFYLFIYFVKLSAFGPTREREREKPAQTPQCSQSLKEQQQHIFSFFFSLSPALARRHRVKHTRLPLSRGKKRDKLRFGRSHASRAVQFLTAAAATETATHTRARGVLSDWDTSAVHPSASSPLTPQTENCAKQPEKPLRFCFLPRISLKK